ncbi:hypothetical protein Tco_0023632 [Tanacetum coccineum]
MRKLLHLLLERNPFPHLKLHQNPSLAKAHYTSSSSPSESPTPTHIAPPPKLHFLNPIKLKPQELPLPQMSPNDPYAQTIDNWPPGPSNPSPPLCVSRPPLSFLNPPPRFEPLPSTQPLFVNVTSRSDKESKSHISEEHSRRRQASSVNSLVVSSRL